MDYTPNLSRVNIEEPVAGPWVTEPRIGDRAFLLRNRQSGHRHMVFYGTRTERNQAQAERQAKLLANLLNRLGAKTL